MMRENKGSETETTHRAITYSSETSKRLEVSNDASGSISSALGEMILGAVNVEVGEIGLECCPL
jgi:hypothetical protein